MKKKGHPPYQDVLFIDTATGEKFICGSTLQPKAKEVYDGKEYPVYHVPISSASHPFFTGSRQFVDSEGRVDQFKRRYAPKENILSAPAEELSVPKRGVTKRSKSNLIKVSKPKKMMDKNKKRQ